MSSLFREISQQAQQQRQTVDQSAVPAVHSSTPSSDVPSNRKQPVVNANPINRPSDSFKPTPKRANAKVAPQSGTVAPKSDTTAPTTKPQIDRPKLETIISELSQLATNSNGLNVRLSAQEAQDMDDFVHGLLRRRGLKGYEVSAAKLMRYAFRYLSRVHEAEFVAALEQVLKVEEKLSI